MAHLTHFGDAERAGGTGGPSAQESVVATELVFSTDQLTVTASPRLAVAGAVNEVMDSAGRAAALGVMAPEAPTSLAALLSVWAPSALA